MEQKEETMEKENWYNLTADETAKKFIEERLGTATVTIASAT